MRTVLVSSHIGARYTDHDEPANHQSWQGKVYSLSDKLIKDFGYTDPKKNVFGKIKEFFQKFRKQETFEDFETVTGYGTIEAICRESKGINNWYTPRPNLSCGNETVTHGRDLVNGHCKSCVGDCAIRACCKATNRTWNEVFYALVQIAYRQKDIVIKGRNALFFSAKNIDLYA